VPALMPDISALIQSGGANAWLLLPVAVVLRGLHALEPGHAKSMMTAFIVAIHGTAAQAVLLALSVTAAQDRCVGSCYPGVAAPGHRHPRQGRAVAAADCLLIVTLALRILSRIENPFGAHGHDHDHHHDNGHGHHHPHAPDPHHGSHDIHSHDDMDEDAHAAAHAAQLKQQIAKGAVTNPDVAWFGLSGGLTPCPAAFAVLLACFHQKAYALGIVMVMAFSIGLAIMLVAIGLIAAWGASTLSSLGLDRFARWAPYASAAIMLVIGLVVTAQGVAALKLV
jgi:nickel/cobalt transporter (NicO) family protein